MIEMSLLITIQDVTPIHGQKASAFWIRVNPPVMCYPLFS